MHHERVYFIEHFEFYLYIIKYFCSHIIYFDSNGPLKYTYTALMNYIGNDNEYLLGLLLVKCIFISLPTPKHC